MTTNIDRAADVVYRTLSGKYGDFGHHEDVAQELADAGYLMPDLPEPTFTTGKAVVWKNDGDEVFLEDGEISVSSATRSPERSQRLALAVFAAATYAERNQK